MADRARFIQQLVAALQEKEGLSVDSSAFAGGSVEAEQSPQTHTGLFLSDGFSSSGDSDRLARDAYTQLQFDFPQIQEQAIEALAELYQRLAADGSPSQMMTQVPVTVTLLEGVAFLNDRSGDPNSLVGRQKTRSSEGSGLLAAAVLLLVFRRCLANEEAPTNALLNALSVKQAKQESVQVEKDKQCAEIEEGAFVEKLAAEEDPDDLSEVYEGHLPVHREQKLSMWNQKAITAEATRVEKLRQLASHTFSSSFEAVSMEKWERWRLDDELVNIMRLLVELPPGELENGKEQTTLFGPQGEWSRYLYVLRDRILRYPGSSRDALWRLKELVEFLQQRHTNLSAQKNSRQRIQRPQHLVYRVLAELAISREFHQGAAQRAQQGLALVIQELLPLIAQEVHRLAGTALPANESAKSIDARSDANESDDGVDDELAVVFLQLLHFMLFASPNARTTTEKLHESGMLRTLLALLPASPTTDTDTEQQLQNLEKRWFTALLRLLGECALWHPGFAGYIVRVPKFAGLVPTLRERFVAEELLLALAFHQHQVQVRSVELVDVWEVLMSPSVFPQQCDSYLEAMEKLQNAVFVLDCLEKALPTLRPAMQKELQRSLQQIYARFARSFEYPTFAGAEISRQQQQFEQQALNHGPEEEGDGEKEKKEEDRGQAEVVQFTALRNKLRQSVKSLLTALASGGPAMSHHAGRVSSKLD